MIEKIQAAMDGKIYAEQAEKFRIILSHMDALKMYKLNLQSLILTTVGKYLPQIDLIPTTLDIKVFSAISIMILD